MKRLLTTTSAFVLLSLASLADAAQGAVTASNEAWINVFVNELPSQSGSRFEYTIQNKSDLAITGIEIGRKNACIGNPSLDPASVSDVSTWAAPSGWTKTLKKSESGNVMIRFDGRSTEKRLKGFIVQGSSAALSGGFVCIYRADAKVWQYKAEMLRDSVAPQISLSLNPKSFQSDTLFHAVTASITTTDDLDSQPQVNLVSIKSSRGDFVYAKEVKDAILGSDDRQFQVLADKLGNFIVEYEVSDAAGNKAFASAPIAIVAGADKTAPVLTVALSPSLIQANNAMVSITATITVKDNADKAPTVRLISITSAANDFNSAADVKNAAYNTDDRSFQLMAKRSKTEDRIYKITYEARDASGNKTSLTQNVTVQAEQKSALEKLIEALLGVLAKLLALFR